MRPELTSGLPERERVTPIYPPVVDWLLLRTLIAAVILGTGLVLLMLDVNTMAMARMAGR